MTYEEERFIIKCRVSSCIEFHPEKYEAAKKDIKLIQWFYGRVKSMNPEFNDQILKEVLMETFL